ncbi:Effector protein SipC [Salmonella enterica subsp. enterica]|nr:Effector protein SipC [Salmonella enterica subsp. enterica]
MPWQIMSRLKANEVVQTQLREQQAEVGKFF